MNEGVDFVEIQALIGHSNVKTTSIYLHVKDYQMLNIISPLDNRLDHYGFASRNYRVTWNRLC